MRPPQIRDPIAAPAKVTRFAGETPVLASASGLRGSIDSWRFDRLRAGVIALRQPYPHVSFSVLLLFGQPSLGGILWAYVDFLWGLGFPDLLTPSGARPRKDPKIKFQLCRRVLQQSRSGGVVTPDMNSRPNKLPNEPGMAIREGLDEGAFAWSPPSSQLLRLSES
ncbi:hypothetical protein PAPYR_5210 [Paratrimastix pyriformis]|uniref:Uncharacterized protein n=1 Tax=Paratrimastix pyriformis TaxID=342808 RepID=A0ABQ8UL17_9EUKA|nr:hypothetical protein PAPYR_5210 [Paratrimastix pyriformis]